eukprot:902563-Amphidinium_carterae.1
MDGALCVQCPAIGSTLGLSVVWMVLSCAATAACTTSILPDAHDATLDKVVSLLPEVTSNSPESALVLLLRLEVGPIEQAHDEFLQPFAHDFNSFVPDSYATS